MIDDDHDHDDDDDDDVHAAYNDGNNWSLGIELLLVSIDIDIAIDIDVNDHVGSLNQCSFKRRSLLKLLWSLRTCRHSTRDLQGSLEGKSPQHAFHIG